MKNAMRFVTLYALSCICTSAASANPLASPVRADRLVYLNGELAGVYSTCSAPDANEYYFSDQFFSATHLRQTDSLIQCEAQQFWKPTIGFVQNAALSGALMASPKSSDYIGQIDTAVAEGAESADIRLPPGRAVQASVLEHELGLWRNLDGVVDGTASLAARQYSAYGLFSLEGYLSSTAGRFQGYVSDVSWKKNYPGLGLSSTFGVNTFASSGSTTTLYGVVLGSNDDAILAGATKVIEGFAEVPGRLQIRIGATLLKELPITAGYFRVPTAGLPTTAGANGQYNLTLLDSAGKVVRTWDVFVPPGSGLLKAGATTWKVFAGQVHNGFTGRSMISGPRNLGGGLVLRHGVTPTLSLEASGLMSEHAAGGGLLGDYEATSWTSLTGGGTRYVGKGFGSSAFAGLDVHFTYMGAYTAYTWDSCDSQYTGSQVSGQCRNLTSHLYFAIPHAGRLTVLHSSTLGGTPRAQSLGFSWAPPSIGRLAWSIYGTRQTYGAISSYSVGMLATLSLDRGNIVNSATAGGGNSTFSSTYSVTQASNNQLLLGTDITHSPAGTQGQVRAGAQFNPWYGNYQINSIVTERGGVSLGVNESGSLVESNGEILPARVSGQGYGIVHVSGLPHVSLEDSSGITQSVTNADGYAVLPAIREGSDSLKVAADELPEDVRVDDALIGRSHDNWSAMRWDPHVRRVNQGWVRVTLADGNPVPLGSWWQFGNDEPDYALGRGQMFVANLPADAGSVVLRYPGDTGRCVVRLSGSIRLAQNDPDNAPVLICYPPSEYRSEYHENNLETGSVTADRSR